MASRTVNLSEGAYKRLAALKREGESFSDVVDRLTGKYEFRKLVGILTERQAEDLRAAIEGSRARARRASRRTAGRMRGR